MSAGTNRLRTKTTRRPTAAVASWVCVAILGAGTALGQGGGGIEAPEPPSIDDVTCVVRCLDLRTVTETGRIEITGESLASAALVKFPAAEGKLKVEPRDVAETAVTAEVPVGAASGRVAVIDEFGAKAASPVKIEVKPEGAITEVEDFTVTQAEATPQKSFYNGRRQAAVDYLFEADGAADVRIDVIEEETGTTVDSIVQENQKPFASHSVAWDGLDGARIAPSGDYRFRVSALSGGAGAAAGFSYYDHIFPLRGAHDYGDGFGAGRNHQGQDIFAKCGTKVVAARGGKVQANAFHSAAGYYVVIDGRKTGQDYAYMHLEAGGRPKEGARVKTGDVIGYESDTGNASGCHLHFELWSAPGWYEGGHALAPTKTLKKWDSWS